MKKKMTISMCVVLIASVFLVGYALAGSKTKSETFQGYTAFATGSNTTGSKPTFTAKTEYGTVAGLKAAYSFHIMNDLMQVNPIPIANSKSASSTSVTITGSSNGYSIVDGTATSTVNYNGFVWTKTCYFNNGSWS